MEHDISQTPLLKLSPFQCSLSVLGCSRQYEPVPHTGGNTYRVQGDLKLALHAEGPAFASSFGLENACILCTPVLPGSNKMLGSLGHFSAQPRRLQSSDHLLPRHECVIFDLSGFKLATSMPMSQPITLVLQAWGPLFVETTISKTLRMLSVLRSWITHQSYCSAEEC